MKSKSTVIDNLFFYYLFVVLQILTFLSVTNTLFIFLNAALVLYLAIRVRVFNQIQSWPTFFLISYIIGAVFQLINGTNIFGLVITIILIFASFVGFKFISVIKPNLSWFNIIMLLEYLFFYTVYFSLGIAQRQDVDADLFGRSSSNTIAMCLNMTLIIYYIISKYYQENRQLLLSAFSIINIVLISIQESRAGVLVAVILFALIIFDSIKTQGKQYIRLFGIIIIIVVILLVIKNIALIRDYLYGIGISESSYEDDVRSLATASFFSQMTWKTALFGYPMETMFAGVDRTFNAFLDLWKNFGILPFAAFFILVILRFSKRKRYSFPMYCFLPMFAYMFFESFMFHSYWDFLIYCFLFLGYKEENEVIATNSRLYDTKR